MPQRATALCDSRNMTTGSDTIPYFRCGTGSPMRRTVMRCCSLAVAATFVLAPAVDALADKVIAPDAVRTTVKTDRLEIADVSLLKAGLDELMSGKVDEARMVRDG